MPAALAVYEAAPAVAAHADPAPKRAAGQAKKPGTKQGSAKKGPANSGGPKKQAKDSGHSGPAAKSPLEMVGKVDGKGWYLPWYKRDPKKPNGPLLPVLMANAETGEITRHGDRPQIVMHVVHARLYQNGVPAANISAATVHADQQAEKVVATGHCRVVSLKNPADTILTADKIIWDTANTKVIAEGHARVVKTPRDGGVPITQEGGRIIFDLEHNTFTVL